MDAGNVWMLTSTALVIFMTPGLAFFYGGLVKAKSVISMLMMNFGCIALIGVLWALYGFNVSAITGTTSDWLPFVYGDPLADPGLFTAYGENPVSLIGVAFGASFAIITTALISGAIADRAKFGSWLVFAALWATIAYFPIAGWVWAVDGDGAWTGWIGKLGEWLFPGSGIETIDWAGGTAVHINAGAAALALSLVLGKRIGFAKGIQKPHNVPFVLLGASILWFGWFGFNTGAAAGTGDGDAGVIFFNTLIAPGAAVLGWLLIEKFKDGKATAVGAASGAVAGLVAITPACQALTPGWAIVLGVVAGALSALAVDLKYALGYDDSLDVVGIHLVAGLVGTLYLGFFATGTGLLTGGDYRQLVVQAIPAFGVAVYSFLVALILAWIIEKSPLGFRVKSQDEIAGLDAVVHGEEAYQTAAER